MAPASPAPVVMAPAVVVDTQTVIVEKPHTPRPSVASPFQRVPARAYTPGPARNPAGPVPRLAAAALPGAAAALSYLPYETVLRSRRGSLEWLKKFRASCASRSEGKRQACERLAKRIETMMTTPAQPGDPWADAMSRRMGDLLASSARAQDFSLYEAQCNSDGCLLYWNSTDYADWRGAGTAFLDALLAEPSFKDFDARSLRRISEFDPLTSTPWELLVIDRRTEPAE